MYTETQYLSWANRMFGTVTYNLARGGVRPVSLTQLSLGSTYDARAWDRLRERTAWYNGVKPQEVLPALGTTHALWLALATLVRPGDEVLVERPAYEPLWRVPQQMGANVLRFERHAERGYALEPSIVAARLTSRTKLVIVSNSHNPSGVRTSDRDLTELAAGCASVGATLLVDEIYAPFGSALRSDGVWGRSARTLASNTVVVSGLSKAYGLGPLRVGWMLADDVLIRQAEYALQSNLGDPPLPQVSWAADVFDSLPALAVAREREFDSASRAMVAQWIARNPQLTWTEPEAGPFGFVSLRERTFDVAPYVERGAQENDVLVAPGAFFDVPHAFRIGWSVGSDHLPEALQRLERALSAVLDEERSGTATGASRAVPVPRSC